MICVYTDVFVLYYILLTTVHYFVEAITVNESGTLCSRFVVGLTDLQFIKMVDELQDRRSKDRSFEYISCFILISYNYRRVKLK